MRIVTIICDRCGKQIKGKLHNIKYGHLKEPPTEEEYDLCNDCYDVWDKRFLETFGSNRVAVDERTRKIALDFIAEIMKNKEKVKFD